MAACLGWFGVRSCSMQQIVDCLRMAIVGHAAREDTPQMFRVVQKADWAVVILEGTGGQYAVPTYSSPFWAQAVSLRTNQVAVSFSLLEGGWSYAVFHSGNELLAQESYALPVPTVYGDRELAGSALGVEPALFGRYEQALQADRSEPFEGDAYAPNDEWAHLDFALRFGLAYPDDGEEGLMYAPTQSERKAAGAQWHGLPSRLAVPAAPPHENTTGQEIDFDHFPSGDDPS